jgi:hypothetical protein
MGTVALNTDGTLKDANDIDFYLSESDKRPIPKATPSAPPTSASPPDDDSDSDLPSTILDKDCGLYKRLKSEDCALIVSGKRHRRKTSRACGSDNNASGDDLGNKKKKNYSIFEKGILCLILLFKQSDLFLGTKSSNPNAASQGK